MYFFKNNKKRTQAYELISALISFLCSSSLIIFLVGALIQAHSSL